MTRFIPFILILPTLLVTDSSVARPLVESPNFVETLCRDVSMERRERRKAGRAGVDRHPDRRVLDSAMEQYLVLIEALGKRGRRIEGSTGSRFLLAAVTLHEGLPEIENLFAEFADGQLPESTSSELRPLLIEFTRSVRAGLSRLPNSASDDPEPVIVSILDPLNRASELASGVKTPSGWWDSDSDAALRASSQSSSASQSISNLDIDDELRSELRSLPERSSLRIASIELCIQLEASTWLNGGVRRDLSSLLVADLRNTRLDQGSQEELERRIAAIRLLIRAFDGLSTSSGGRAVARKGSESMLDLLEPWPDRLPSAETTIGWSSSRRSPPFVIESPPDSKARRPESMRGSPSSVCLPSDVSSIPSPTSPAPIPLDGSGCGGRPWGAAKSTGGIGLVARTGLLEDATSGDRSIPESETRRRTQRLDLIHGRSGHP